MEQECRRFSNLITALVDDELQSAEKSEVENHFKICPPCHQRYQNEKRVKRVVADRLPVISAPAYLVQRIRHHLQSGRAWPGFWELLRDLFVYHPLSASFAAAALILIVALPTYFLSIHRDQTANFAGELNGKVVELQGQIICLDCAYTYHDEQNQTPHTEIHRIGIRCAADQIWTFLDTRPHQELLHDPKYLQRNVLVKGVVYQDARYVFIKDYQLL